MIHEVNEIINCKVWKEFQISTKNNVSLKSVLVTVLIQQFSSSFWWLFLKAEVFVDYFLRSKFLLCFSSCCFLGVSLFRLPFGSPANRVLWTVDVMLSGLFLNKNIKGFNPNYISSSLRHSNNRNKTNFKGGNTE